MVMEPVQPIVLWLMRARRLRLARVLNVLLVPLLAYQLARLTWLFLPVAPTGVEIVLPKAPGAQAMVERPLGDSRRIAAWHLLGVAGAEPPPQEAIAAELPETTLKLTLRGCYSVDSQAQALAIIADDRGEELPYRIGDALPGGAMLREINVSEVLLSRNGRREILRLPKDEAERVTGKWGRTGRAARYTPRQDPREVELMLDQYRDFLENEPVEDHEH